MLVRGERLMSVVQEIFAGASAKGDSRRAVRRNAIRALRPGRTPAGIVVAAVLSVGAWALAVEIIATIFGSPVLWPPLHRLMSTTFGDPAVPGTAAMMIVCGAGLVALAVLPGRPRLVPLECEDPLLVMGLTRAGLSRTLAVAAQTVEGVRRARVRMLRGQIEVVVVTEAKGTGELLREVGAAVGDQLSGLGAQCRHEVVVRLRRRRV
ncbi:hypothetical protein Psi02_22930 [Planotetraspora silvatica]|uniref:DUF6286 domain-containing protein n=2 Tax=Planotetraspora silvatica TaxID=234614 RepID=A0A8J3UP83_9ACTN|nr:hypothetical protein Psi02_22930 [Planotetraspora silvatica]